MIALAHLGQVLPGPSTAPPQPSKQVVGGARTIPPCSGLCAAEADAAACWQSAQGGARGCPCSHTSDVAKADTSHSSQHIAGFPVTVSRWFFSGGRRNISLAIRVRRVRLTPKAYSVPCVSEACCAASHNRFDDRR